jgi:hypothetical protein
MQRIECCYSFRGHGFDGQATAGECVGGKYTGPSPIAKQHALLRDPSSPRSQALEGEQGIEELIKCVCDHDSGLCRNAAP